MNSFARMKLRNYWFKIMTSNYLVQLLKQKEYNLPRLSNETITNDLLKWIIEDM